MMMRRCLDDRELTGSPGRGIAYDGKVVEKQLGVAALTADSSPERQFAAASQGYRAGTDRSGFDLGRPDQIGRPTVRASRSHVLNFPVPE
jgi:hypothetical protein